MRVGTLSVLSLAGMLITGAAVYLSTSPGGAAAGEVAPGPGAAAEAAERPAEGPSAPPGARITATGTIALEAALGHGALLRGAPGETFVMLEVRGRTDEKATARAPVNLALVLDRSGSMRGERLRNAIEAARAAVDRLQDGDVVSVLAFDTKTSVVVPPTPIDARTRGGVASAIQGITLGGDTCISCAIEDGMALLEQTEGKVSRMVLLSDGDATAGVRDVPGFRTIAQRARDKGMSVTTVGVNVDYNERILSAVAEESNGQHYFVENEAALARALESEAEALTRTLASGAEAAVELGPGVELVRVYDRSFRRSGARVVVPLGALSSGEVKTVLLSVRVAPGAGAEAPVASVELAYRDLVRGEPAKLGGALAAKVTDDRAEASELDPVVGARVQRSETASALGEANRLFLQGQVDAARQKLDEQSTRLRTAAAGAKKSPKKLGDAAARDLEGQAATVDRVSGRFKPSRIDGNDPFSSAQGKGAVRESSKSGFDLRK